LLTTDSLPVRNAGGAPECCPARAAGGVVWGGGGRGPGTSAVGFLLLGGAAAGPGSIGGELDDGAGRARSVLLYHAQGGELDDGEADLIPSGTVTVAVVSFADGQSNIPPGWLYAPPRLAYMFSTNFSYGL
jgi:hypothetical protein